MSAIEGMLALHIRAAKLPAPVREFRFDAIRKWRFDFAWPDYMIAAECEGATWTLGRHTSGKGFESDCHKYNHAARDGWKVFRFTSGMVKTGEALQMIEQALKTDFP